jgi:hypothetical protein
VKGVTDGPLRQVEAPMPLGLAVERGPGFRDGVEAGLPAPGDEALELRLVHVLELFGISKRAMMPGSPPLASSSGSGSRVATHG